MIEAFDHCNHRPEPFRAVFKALKYKTDVTPEDIDEVFMSMVASSLASAKANFLQQVNGLNPLDLAALKVMARDDKKFSPYSKTSFADYKAFIFAQTGEMPEAIPQSSVQQALERLRGEKFVWRAGRGAYLIEDTQHAVWMKEVVEQSVDDVDRARREINARVATS